MGSTQVIPSFPASVWDGTSPSRPAATSDRPPTSEDYARLVSELQAMQNYILNGQQNSILAITFEPNNYTGSADGIAVDMGQLDGKPSSLIYGTGPVNGDTFFTLHIEESNFSTGPFVSFAETPVFSAAKQVSILSFVNTKKWVRVTMLEGGEDADGHAFAFIIKGQSPTTLFVTVGANSYTSNGNGDAVDFGAVDGKDFIGYATTGVLNGDTLFTISYEESSDDMVWKAIPNSTMPALFNSDEAARIQLPRTRRYVRATYTVTGVDADGHIAVTLGRL